MAADLLISPTLPLLATVSLLNSTRTVASARLRHRLEREGRVVLLEGAPSRAARLARALARRGFTPSVNLRVPD